MARGKRQTKREKKAAGKSRVDTFMDKVNRLIGGIPPGAISTLAAPAESTPILDGLHLLGPQPARNRAELQAINTQLREIARNTPVVMMTGRSPGGRTRAEMVADYSLLEHRMLAEAFRRPVPPVRTSVPQLTIDSYSMGTRVGYTDCPQCPNGRTDRDGQHWHQSLVEQVLPSLFAYDILTKAMKRSPPRLPFLGDLMKKGGRSIDQIINDRVGDYHSLDKPRDAGFTNYLKDTYGWSGREARRQWRALLDRDIDPAVILNARRATWRKMTQSKQPNALTSVAPSAT